MCVRLGKAKSMKVGVYLCAREVRYKSLMGFLLFVSWRRERDPQAAASSRYMQQEAVW